MGADGCLEKVIQSVDPPVNDDHDSNDNSLWERMLKVVADRDVKSSGSQREGEEGKDMGAPIMAFAKEEA